MTASPAPSARDRTDAPFASYLRDHHALISSSMMLAERSLRQNLGIAYESVLRSVLEDSGHDLTALRSVMAVFEVEPSTVRVAATRLGELIGRLKFNGSWSLKYSPASRVLEAEALMMLVQGRLSLWKTVQAAISSDELPAEVDLAEVQRRGREQLDRLEELHTRATPEAFGDLAP